METVKCEPWLCNPLCVNYVVVSPGPEALNFLARLGWELSSSSLIHVRTLGEQRSQRPVAMGKRAGTSVAISSTMGAAASSWNVRDILCSDRGVPRSKSSRILHSSWSAPLSPSTLTSRRPSRRSPSSVRTPLAHRCPPGVVVVVGSSPSC